MFANLIHMHVQGDRLGYALDRQVAGQRGSIRTGGFIGSRDEGNLRELGGIQKFIPDKLVIQTGDPGIDAVHRDGYFRGAVVDLRAVILDLGVEVGEPEQRVGIPQVQVGKNQVAMILVHFIDAGWQGRGLLRIRGYR